MLGLSACGSEGGAKLAQSTLTFTEKDPGDLSFVDNPPATKLGRQGPEKLSDGDHIWVPKK